MAIAMSPWVPDRLESDWYTRLRILISGCAFFVFGTSAVWPGFADKGVIAQQYGHGWAILIYAALALGSLFAMVALALDLRGYVYLADACNGFVAATTILAYTTDPRPSAMFAFLLLIGLPIADIAELRDTRRERPSRG